MQLCNDGPNKSVNYSFANKDDRCSKSAVILVTTRKRPGSISLGNSDVMGTSWTAITRLNQVSGQDEPKETVIVSLTAEDRSKPLIFSITMLSSTCPAVKSSSPLGEVRSRARVMPGVRS